MKRYKRGSIEYLSALMLICLTGILLAFSFSVKELRQYESDVRDSLDSACLSAALIDLNTYSFGRTINIKEYNDSWNIFKKCLKNNMGLDDNFYPGSKAVYDKVTIHEFIVYNIIENYLISYRFTGDGRVNQESVTYTGSETTPDGSSIESSTIYADIGMNIKSFLGKKEYVHVKTSVDIVNN